MRFNQIDLLHANPSVELLLSDASITVVADANILIPPDRTKENPKLRPFRYDLFESTWLIPLTDTFTSLSIHEAVYNELLTASKQYVDRKVAETPPKISILKNSDLNDKQKVYYATIETKIAKHTAYSPSMNNKDDRGEVKSLAYMATVGFVYFCSHDSGAVRLVEKADVLGTCLDSISVVKNFEIIFLLLYHGFGDKDKLKAIYKYHYHITDRDKGYNPQWHEFIEGMKLLYGV